MGKITEALTAISDAVSAIEESVQVRRDKLKTKRSKKPVEAVEKVPKTPTISPAEKKRIAQLEALRGVDIKMPKNGVIVQGNAMMEKMVADLERNELITLDTETNGLDWVNNNIVGVVAYSPLSDTSYYVPLFHKTDDIVNFPIEYARAMLNPILASKKIGKVGHNILPFDGHFCREAGFADISDSVVADTRIMAMVLNENGSHALKDLVKEYLEGYDDVDRYDTLFGNLPFDEIPVSAGVAYALKDGVVNWHLYKFFMSYLDQPKFARLRSLVFDVEMPVLKVVYEMERNGVAVDTAYLEGEKEKAKVHLAEIEDKLYTVAGKVMRRYIGKALQAKNIELRGLMKELGIASSGGLEVDPYDDIPRPLLTEDGILYLAKEHLGLGEPSKQTRILRNWLDKQSDLLRRDQTIPDGSLKLRILDGLLDYIDWQNKAIEVVRTERYEFNVGSPAQLCGILYDIIGLEINKFDGRSASEASLKEIIFEIEGREVEGEATEADLDLKDFIQTVLDHREVAKILSAFLEKLPVMTDKQGRIHTHLNSYGAKTGRWTSSEPNLQQIPKFKSINVRNGFVADEGRLLMSIDYSQIELRLIAHFSNDPKLVWAYENDKDVHQTTASVVFLVDFDEVSKKQRSDAKPVNFGIAYGITDMGLSRQLKTSRARASEIIENFLRGYVGIKRDMDDTIAFTEENGYSETILGRKRRLPEIWTPSYVGWDREKRAYVEKKASERLYAERQCFNAKIQGSGADILKVALVNLMAYREAENVDFRFLLQIHDEIIYDIPESWAKYVEETKVEKDGTEHIEGHWEPVAPEIKRIQEIMEQAIPLRVPVKCEVSIKKRWGEGVD